MLSRFVTFALFTSACAAAPTPAPANHSATPTTYQLLPLQLRGLEGRHSASHSSTAVGGSLVLDGASATLTLAMTTAVGHVHCPNDAPGFGMQACVPRGTPDTSSEQALVLRGELRRDHGTLAGTLRDGDRELALACTPSLFGLACRVTQRDVFGMFRQGPATMAFGLGPRRFAMVPLDVADVGMVEGAIEMTAAGVVEVALSVDGGSRVRLPGRAIHRDADHGGHGVLFTAQLSPTRTFSARCTIEGDHLGCEVTADRSVLGRSEHVIAQTEWLAQH